MTRVLYIGDPNSVHDHKWITWFSNQPNFKVFLTAQEHEFQKISEENLAFLEAHRISLTRPIKSYSLWRFWENSESAKTINEVIAKEKIDLVHVLFATPFALWTRRLSIPSVITTRGSDIHVVLAGLGKGSLLKRIHGTILLKKFKSAFENASVITSTSQGQLDKINSIFSTRINGEIIRTGVNVDEINSLEPKLELPPIFNGKKIIFLPRYIQPIYQTELQIKAFTELPTELRPKIALIFIKGKRTPEAYMNKIESLLKTCGLPYHIFESLTQHQMWSMFKLSAVSIMTPKTDGTPNSALEAMAAKCPLILGSFNYDGDLFSDEFCIRMKTNKASELTDLTSLAIDNYSIGRLENAFENVSIKGNRLVEMERLEKLYLSLTKR